MSTSSASGSTATVAAEVWIRPLASVAGTRCTRCTPLSNFSAAKTPLPGHLRHQLAKAAELGRRGLDHLPAPAARLGEPLVHPRQVGGEERRLLAAGPGADLEDRRALVGVVPRQQRQLHRPLRPGQRRADARQLLLGEFAHLGIAAQPLRLLLARAAARDSGGSRPPPASARRTRATGAQLGRRGALAHPRLEILVAGQNLVELLFRIIGASCRRRPPPASPMSGARRQRAAQSGRARLSAPAARGRAPAAESPVAHPTESRTGCPGNPVRPPMPETFDFAVSGINHAHIYGQVDAHARRRLPPYCLLHARGRSRRRFRRTYPQARRVADEREILEDDAVRLVVGAGIPADRAGVALRAMRAGKDVMLDKPGCTTEAQLAELRRVQAETGASSRSAIREHYCSPPPSPPRASSPGAPSAASSRPSASARTGRAPRPPRPGSGTARTAAILVDIASHQFEQFLHFTGHLGRILGAVEAQPCPSRAPGLERLRPRHRRIRPATGFVRVDWLTPAGSPVWGDGRLLSLGTEGAIELRKYIDTAGRPGGDHLFLTDARGIRHFDCSGTQPRLRRAAPRRRPAPDRDRDAPGALLPRDASSRSRRTASPPRSPARAG